VAAVTRAAVSKGLLSRHASEAATTAAFLTFFHRSARFRHTVPTADMVGAVVSSFALVSLLSKTNRYGTRDSKHPIQTDKSKKQVTQQMPR